MGDAIGFGFTEGTKCCSASVYVSNGSSISGSEEAYAAVNDCLNNLLTLLLRNGGFGDRLLPLQLHVGHGAVQLRSGPWTRAKVAVVPETRRVSEEKE